MQEVRIIDRGRGPEIAGTRFTVYQIVPSLLRGRSAAEIADTFGMTIPQVEALTRYYEEHKEEVLKVHQRIEERIARGNPPWVEAILAASPLRPRLEARLEELRKRRLEDENGEGQPG
jgi:uncharacterized protein (DUF433 family)